MMAALRRALDIRKLVVVDIAPRKSPIEADSQLDRYFCFMSEINRLCLTDKTEIIQRLRSIEPVHQLCVFRKKQLFSF